MTSVFLSYSAHDKEVARDLANALTRQGISVWFDQLEILAGDSILSRIREGIESVDYLLVLLSRSSNESVWVKREIGFAFEKFGEDAGTVIIPVKIDDTPVPAAFTSTKYVDFSPDPVAALDEIVRRISRDNRDKAVLRKIVDVSDLAADLASERKIPRGPEFYVTAAIGFLTIVATLFVAWPSFETTFANIPKVYYDFSDQKISLPQGVNESVAMETLKKAGIAPAALQIRVVNKGRVLAREVKIGATVSGSFLYAQTDPTADSKSVLMNVSIDSFSAGDKEAIVVLKDLIPNAPATVILGYDPLSSSSNVDVVAAGLLAEQVSSIDSVEEWTLWKAFERPLQVLFVGFLISLFVGIILTARRNPRLRKNLLDLLEAIAPQFAAILRVITR